MRKIDFIFIAVVAIFLTILFMAPEETIIYVPYDDNHQEFTKILREEGKKATEKFCDECHNADNPLSEQHPPKYRCLFCHKLAPPQ